MRWIRVGAVDLLECTECDGTWIETAAFERLCATREQQAVVVQKGTGAGGSGTPTLMPADRIRYRPCPQCQKLMNRQNFGRLSGTIVDTCSGHGTFLDRGELHKVVRFILDGGLDRARQAEVERLKEEQRRLRELERHLSRTRMGQDWASE